MMIFEDMNMPDSLSLWNLPAEENVSDEMLLAALAAYQSDDISAAQSRRPNFWGRWRRALRQRHQDRLPASEL